MAGIDAGGKGKPREILRVMRCVISRSAEEVYSLRSWESEIRCRIGRWACWRVVDTAVREALARGDHFASMADWRTRRV